MSLVTFYGFQLKWNEFSKKTYIENFGDRHPFVGDIVPGGDRKNGNRQKMKKTRKSHGFGVQGRSPLAYEGHAVTHSRLTFFAKRPTSCVSVFPLSGGHRILVFGNIVTGGGFPHVTSDALWDPQGKISGENVREIRL